MSTLRVLPVPPQPPHEASSFRQVGAAAGGEELAARDLESGMNTVPQSAAKLCVSRSLAYRLVTSGEIRSYLFASGRRISNLALQEYVARNIAK